MTDMPIRRLSMDSVFNVGQTGVATGHVQKMQFEDDGVQKVNFKDTLAHTLQSVNETVSAPDAMMQKAMTTGEYDVHDVMIANAKAELAVNMTTQVAYDRILQIQI